MSGTARLHFLVPTGFRTTPSGGNVYDRHLLTGLTDRGWQVVPDEVASVDGVAAALVPLPDDALVLVDSLVASWAAGVLLAAGVQVVPLVHMLFGTPHERELLSDAPAVIATSDWTRRRLLAQYALDPRRVHVAVPGVERALRAPGTAAGTELLCVAALTPAKGHDVLLGALARLTDLDWRCTLAGSLEQEPELVDTLRKQAADLGITERVQFAGELVGEDLEAAYVGADLLVLPSRAETYGMVVTEALAHGLPVVASSVGGVPEALGEVGPNHPGMLVRPNDPEALARALRRWLEDASLRQWLGSTAAARLSSLPTWLRTSTLVAEALEGR